MSRPITPIDILKVFAGDAVHLRTLENQSSFETLRITEQLPQKARALRVDAIRRILEDLQQQKITLADASLWAIFVFSHSTIEEAWDREHTIRDALTQIRKAGEGTIAPLTSNDLSEMLQRL